MSAKNLSAVLVNEAEPAGPYTVRCGATEIDVRPRSLNSVKAAAKELKVTREEIRQAIQRAKEGDQPAEPFEVTLDGESVLGGAPLAALDKACEGSGEFIRWQGKADLCAVDIDVVRPWDREKLYGVAYRAGADRAWLSRNNGGRLIFCADATHTALERACAAVVLLDLAYDASVDRVELLANTRRPSGEVIRETSTLRDGSSVSWLLGWVEGRELGETEIEAVDAWLADEGLRRGRRNPHSLCPIEPKRVKGDDPVVPLERGVYCYRCANTNGDGFRSYAALLGEWSETAHPLVEAARNRVHWPHQSVILKADWPAGLAWKAARVAYTAVLKAVGADEDERGQVFNEKWIWLRCEGGAWLNPRSLKTDGVADALPVLSWTQGSRRELVTQAKNPGPLPGYREVRPVSCQLNPASVPDGVVAVSKRPDVKPQREDVMPWAEAFALLEQALPKINERYVKALLLACACAEGGGEVIGLVATGTSGSGKTSTASVIANLLGAECPVMRLDVSGEDWRRQIGGALSAGCRPLVVNEVDKVTKFRSHMSKLLNLQEPHTWRPLYGSDVQTRWSTPIILTCINLPEAFQAPELGRRFRLIRLLGRVPDWYGARLQTWRERSDETGRAADSMLAWACVEAERLGYSWDACANTLGLKPANEGDPDVLAYNREQMRALWDLCRNGSAPRAPDSGAYKGRCGWVDLEDPRARAILEPLLPDVADPSRNNPRVFLNRDLMAADWSSLVGEPVHFEGRIHGASWVGRFCRDSDVK